MARSAAADGGISRARPCCAAADGGVSRARPCCAAENTPELTACNKPIRLLAASLTNSVTFSYGIVIVCIVLLVFFPIADDKRRVLQVRSCSVHGVQCNDWKRYCSKKTFKNTIKRAKKKKSPTRLAFQQQQQQYAREQRRDV